MTEKEDKRDPERANSAPIAPTENANGGAAVDSVLAAKARAKAKRALAKAAKAEKKASDKAAAKPPKPRAKKAQVVVESPAEPSAPSAVTAVAGAAPNELQSAALPEHAVARLLHGAHRTPHAILGAHPAQWDGVAGVVIRAMYPTKVSVSVVLAPGEELPMHDEGNGLHTLFLPGKTLPMRYTLRIAQPDGRTIERDDPYRFLPTVGEIDLHLFGEGRHLRLWEKLGAHPRTMDGVKGTAFAVWAPNATRVSLIGSFNAWDTRVHPMRALGTSGVWELFVPGVGANALYKFEIASPTGALRVKTDPMAFQMELTFGACVGRRANGCVRVAGQRMVGASRR